MKTDYISRFFSQYLKIEVFPPGVLSVFKTVMLAMFCIFIAYSINNL